MIVVPWFLYHASFTVEYFHEESIDDLNSYCVLILLYANLMPFCRRLLLLFRSPIKIFLLEFFNHLF